MTTGPLEIEPPDDTGSRTLERFVYQAHVAVPYVVAAGLAGSPLSVISEHIEDMACEHEGNSWRFYQIKTRDPGQRPWRLSQLCDDSGAFKSLYRTYQTVEPLGVPYQLFAVLEGSPAIDDLALDRVARGAGATDEAAHTLVSRRLRISPSQAQQFLSRVVVKYETLRADVENRNLRYFGDQAPHLTYQELQRIYQSIYQALLSAMMAERLGVNWETLVTGRDDRVDRKRITAARALTLVSMLAAPLRPLLARAADPTMPRLSKLEEKLAAGGGDDRLILDAVQLRNSASSHELQQQSASRWPNTDVVADTDTRLRILANSVVTQVSSYPHPASSAWALLLERLMSAPDACDPNDIYSKDSFLQLGRICGLSDLCQVEWGRRSA